MSVRRIAAVLLMTPLVLTACGGNSGSGSSPSATAPASTSAASSSSSSSESASASASSSDVTGEAVDKNTFVADLTRGMESVTTYKTATVTEVSGQKMQGVGEVDMSDKANPKMHLKMTTPMGDTDMILIGTTSYLKMAALGPKYVKSPKPANASLGGDVAKQLSESKDAMKSVTLVGEEQVSGTATKRYRIVLDATAALKMAGGGASIPPAAAAGLKDVQYDVWVDGENRTRKFDMEMGMSGQTMKVSGTMSDFGTPVSISAPPADQVTDTPAVPTAMPTAS